MNNLMKLIDYLSEITPSIFKKKKILIERRPDSIPKYLITIDSKKNIRIDIGDNYAEGNGAKIVKGLKYLKTRKDVEKFMNKMYPIEVYI